MRLFLSIFKHDLIVVTVLQFNFVLHSVICCVLGTSQPTRTLPITAEKRVAARWVQHLGTCQKHPWNFAFKNLALSSLPMTFLVGKNMKDRNLMKFVAMENPIQNP